MINSMQNVQFKSIRDVKNFDVRVYNSKNPTIDKEMLKSLKGVDDFFQISDITLYSSQNSTTFTLRCADEKLYSNKRFLDKFEFFHSPKGNDYIASTSGDFSYLLDYYFIKKNYFSRAMIVNLPHNIPSYFYSNSPHLNDMVFASNENEVFDYGDKYYGIYSNNLKALENDLRKHNIKYSTYRDFNTSIMTALYTERYLFMFALFFIFVILNILLLRLSIRGVSENYKNIMILLQLGMIKKDIYLLFILPLVICNFLSILLGSICSYIFSLKNVYTKFFTSVFLSEGLELQFSAKAFIIYVLVSFSLTCCYLFVLTHYISKVNEVDFYE